MILVHNKTPDHACAVCGAAYSSLKDLCVHFQKVHNITEDLLEDLSPDSDSAANSDIDKETANGSNGYESDKAIPLLLS
jgi:hypothetical protein